MPNHRANYLFYDIETTGLNPCFDQVVQFAAIRTDLELNEIERHEFFVKTNIDTVPSPQALITHQVDNDAQSDAITEWQAMEKIHRLLNQPGTISLGYNTLGFDDEFLRFSFYRNLLPCYTHQYANGCSRMDLYPITVLYALYAPDSLTWPHIDERISLKLEHLNEANQLASGQAHNAMVDVEATVALCAKLKARDNLWRFACGYFNKPSDLTRMQGLNFAIAVSGKIGYAQQFQAPVLHLGQHQHYKNQSLWLRLDQEALCDLKPDDIADKTFVLRKRAAEPPIILPPKERYLAKIDSARTATYQNALAHLEANPKLLQAISDYHQHYKYPVETHVDCDAALYQLPFMSNNDQAIARQIHLAAPSEWLDLAKRFAEPTYLEITERLLGRHFPENLTKQAHQRFNEYLVCIEKNQARKDHRGQSSLTRQAATQACQELIKQELSTRQSQLVRQLLEKLK